MAASLGPDLIEDGLVLSLDAGDINSVMGSTVEVLVVAGGGGGGMDMGGGGGGGGVVYNSSYAVTQGTAVTVTVGNGGTGAPAAGTNGQNTGHQYNISATQGGNSVFGSITSTGGGYGGSSYFGYTPNNGYGGNGGSGGGASGYSDTSTGRNGTGSAGQGFNGGASSGQYYSGGGGGAGGVGSSGPNIPNGGPGVLYPTISPYYFGGGGGGSAYSVSPGGNGGIGGGGGGAVGITTGGAGLNNGSPGGGGSPNTQANTPGGDAGTNTGGGGGGGSHYQSTNNKGGNGGSGIVIVRYSGPQKATGGTITTVAGYTIHTFTSSGTFTPTSIWYDISGNSNNGTLVNGVGYSGSNIGSFSFNGSNQRVSTNYKPSGERSYFIWVKFSSLTHSSGYSLTGTQESNSFTYIGIQNGGDVYYYAGANTGGNIGNPVTVNTWVNLGFALFPDGSRRVYKNGIEIHYNTGGLGGTATLEFSVGCINQNHFITGSISRVSIYNRALSAAEVSQNYNSTKSRFGL